MPATPNPFMNSKIEFSSQKYSLFKLGAANDLIYGLHQSRVDRNYSSNNNNNNNTSEQDKFLNTSPLRTDLKLSVNKLFI